MGLRHGDVAWWNIDAGQIRKKGKTIMTNTLLSKKFFSLILVFVVVAMLFFGLNVFAVDQIKTTETFVGNSDTAISSQVDKTFNLYIGDNLSGVANPMKSVYFKVSGVYTGGAGSLALSIDGDAGTIKTFNLPIVTVPTPFEILYKDTAGKINPTSAGSYSYTLNINPSGVTIYGLGAKVVETHRYIPASCDDGQPSNEKLKTTETFVGNSDIAVSSMINHQFTLYIGDNLSGVANPMKSAYFKVSGVYTGGAGSVVLSIDGDAGTIKTFNLPIVTVPTPFEILYKDTAGKINPTSAGSYSYTLNINPSGVTIYGLGAKVVETHRYKPPSCGVFPIKGELLSAVFDSGIVSGAAYNSILWKGTLAPGNTGKVRFQFATSENIAGPWNFIGGSTCQSGDWFDPGASNIPIELTCPTSFNNRQYFRYKVEICSDNCTSAGSASPTVHDVVINWAP